MKAGPGAEAGCPVDEPAGSEEESVASVFQAGLAWFFSWWRGNGLVVLKSKSGADEFLPMFFAAGMAPLMPVPGWASVSGPVKCSFGQKSLPGTGEEDYGFRKS